MSDNLEHFKKMIKAMDKRNAKSVVLEKEYLDSVLNDIESLELQIKELKKEIEDDAPKNRKTNTIISHGGFFK